MTEQIGILHCNAPPNGFSTSGSDVQAHLVVTIHSRGVGVQALPLVAGVCHEHHVHALPLQVRQPAGRLQDLHRHLLGIARG